MQRCVWRHKEPLDTFACKVAKRQALWPAVSVPYLSIEGTGTNMLAGFPTCEICVTYGETLWNERDEHLLSASGCWHPQLGEAGHGWTKLRRELASEHQLTTWSLPTTKGSYLPRSDQIRPVDLRLSTFSDIAKRPKALRHHWISW